VTSIASGDPIAGAKLTADGVEATSDENGEFALPGLPAGPIEVLVTHDAYDDVTQPVTLIAGMDTTRIKMVPKPNAATRVDSLRFAPLQEPVRISGPGSIRIKVQSYGVVRDGLSRDTNTMTVMATPPLTAGWEVAQGFRDVRVSASGPGTGTVTISYNGKSSSIEVTAEDLKFKQFSLSAGYGCGLAQDDTAWCWGGNIGEVLGARTLGLCVGSVCQYGYDPGNPTPIPVIGDRKFTQIAASALLCTPYGTGTGPCGMTCALTSAGEPWCWGWKLSIPPIKMEIGMTLASLTISASEERRPPVRSTACGLTANGKAYCFTPTAASPIADTVAFQAWEAGSEHFCGISSGDIYCWGGNRNGNLGIGSADTVNHPDPIKLAMPVKFTAIGVGRTSTCALDTDGAVLCWGYDGVGGYYQSGFQTSWCSSSDPKCIMTPQQVSGGRTYVAISQADDGPAMCALTSDGAVDCWAEFTGARGSPVLPEPATAIGASQNQACALSSSGTLYCWDSKLNAKKFPS
jgi:hypothetical protein